MGNADFSAVKELKLQVKSLEKRVQSLEQKLAGEPLLTELPPLAAVEPDLVLPLVAEKESPVPVVARSAEPLITLPNEPKESSGAPYPDQSLEGRIGLYWLGRLGIGFLVIGVALLIMYSFQYFGAVAKLTTGYGVAAALILLSEFHERRKSMEWYTQVLTGGGWSLAFFTAYAMHHVVSVRVIEDPLVGLAAMLVVAIGSIMHALSKRSEVLSIFAVSIGFLTLTLNPVTIFSGVASGVLLLITVFLVAKQKWYRLFSDVVCVFYVAQLWLSGLFSLPSEAVRLELFYRSAVFLLPAFLSFSLLPLALSEEEKNHRGRILTGVMVNAIGFVALFLFSAHRAFNQDIAWVNLTIAACFAVFGYISNKRGLAPVATVNSLFALHMATTYFPASGHQRLGRHVYPAEIAILVWAGIRYQLRSFRWFAAALAGVVCCWATGEWSNSENMLIAGVFVPYCGYTGLVSFLALSYAGYEQWKQMKASAKSNQEWTVLFYYYWHLAAFVGWMFPYVLLGKCTGLASDHMQILRLFSWLLEATVAALVALRIRNSYFQYASVLGFLICGCFYINLVSFQHDPAMPTVYLASMLMYFAAFALYSFSKNAASADARILFLIQFFLASFCVGMMIPHKLLSNCVSSAWALQGMLLLVCGFWLREKLIRVSGLILFGLVVLRLLFIDLASAATIYRIVAFIGTGIVLLGSAYGYAMFTKLWMDDDTKNGGITDRSSRDASPSPASPVSQEVERT